MSVQLLQNTFVLALGAIVLIKAISTVMNLHPPLSRVKVVPEKILAKAVHIMILCPLSSV
jgi:hypothetical protein